MIFKSPFKRIGFTMMEVLLAVFIVGILAAVTIPIISRQLEKSDEYSYYLAYRTVEKMAGQIVAQGDPAEDTTAINIKDDYTDKRTMLAYLKDKMNESGKPFRTFIAAVERRIVLTESYMFSKLFPRVYAEWVTSKPKNFVSIRSEDYDTAWLGAQVCLNNRTDILKTITSEEKTRTKEDGTTETYIEETKVYYNKNEGKSENPVFNCDDYGVTSFDADNDIRALFSPNSDFALTDSNLSSIIDYLKGQSTPSAKNFCENKFKSFYEATKQVGTKTYTLTSGYEEEGDFGDDGSSEDGEGDAETPEGFQEAPSSNPAGSCNLTGTYTYYVAPDDVGQSNSKKPTFSADWCERHNYVNMVNASTETVDCQCDPSSYIVSANNEKACFAAPVKSNEQVYDFNGRAVYCSTDFNSKSGTCCPKNSTFDGSACQCIAGYKKEGSSCVLDYCPRGSHKSADGVCITNPPIVKADRFCELIRDNWNLSNSSCNTFSDGSNANVYNAALGADGGNYLSIKSKVGAFKDLTPNIVFANGLRMWILGDKAASMPGLSATPTGAKSTQNMCQKVSLTNNNAAACVNAGGYFCKDSNNCFALADKANATVDDARGCCASVDLTDYITAAHSAGEPDKYKQASVAYAISGFTVFVDINGDKGNGTLWDDVYPFYIAANGIVYPGYPLDAAKSEAATSNSLYLGGNSEKQLPVDVYYYTDSSDTRKKITAFSNVSYARAACSARKVSQYTPYCMNLGEKFTTSGIGGAELKGMEYLKNDNKATSKNPCDTYNCFVTVRRRLRSF